MGFRKPASPGSSFYSDPITEPIRREVAANNVDAVQEALASATLDSPCFRAVNSWGNTIVAVATSHRSLDVLKLLFGGMARLGGDFAALVNAR